MAWKNLIGPYAITSRRRVIASALMYGLSLTVRFTSPAGGEAENPAQAAQAIAPMLSILIKDGVPISGEWRLQPAVVFQRARSPGFAGCPASCERTEPMSRKPDCPPP